MTSDESITTSNMGTTAAQWMSPELLVPDKFGLKESSPTKESDCYALGMVIYEVLSGRTQFSGYPNPVVVLKIVCGERPSRPQGAQGIWFTDSIWRILELCWRHPPGDRINAKTVLMCLESIETDYDD